MVGFKKLFSRFILTSLMSRSIELLVLPVWKWSSSESFFDKFNLIKTLIPKVLSK